MYDVHMVVTMQRKDSRSPARVNAVLAGLMLSCLCVATDLLEVTKQLTCMNYKHPQICTNSNT